MTQDPNRALWWQKGVVYQIYPRSFKDSNGDGVGDLRGIAEKLDYLAALGVDALWLSPFFRSPMADFGYDVADYTDVDPIFGTLADFDAMLAKAHSLGLKVIIDFVPNHSSDQHPWFQESRSSRANPKRDWYFWRDPRPGGGPPNNWLSAFGGPAWTLDEKTGQYYLHSFLREQPDLNWRNPAVKTAMFDAMRFWLERAVDGFRIDVAHFIMKDPALRDNPPNPDYRAPKGFYKPMGEFDSLLHVNDLGHPDVHGAFREIRALLDSYDAKGPRYTVGEIHVFDWKQWAAYYGANLDELHMPFNFGFIALPWQAKRFREVVESVEAAVPPGGWPNYVLSNHDEHRIASRYGAAQARIAMMLLLTLRGTPTLYYGDEIGMPDVPIPPEKEQDPWGKRVPGMGLGRDPERTPMQWDSAPNAGFCPAGVEPWLPVGADYARLNVAAQLNDPRSMYSLTHRLLTLRRSAPALVFGDHNGVAGMPEDCFVYGRQQGTQQFLVALNFSDSERTLALPGGRGQVLLSTTLDREGAEALSAFRLRGNEGCVIKLSD